MKEDMETAKQMPHILVEEELKNIVGGRRDDMSCVGGIVGIKDKPVKGYNTGAITGGKDTGGLVGNAAKGSSNE